MNSAMAFHKIEKRRLELGVSGCRLERVAGISTGHYSNLSNGRAEPREPTLAALKIALHRLEMNADCDAGERSRLIDMIMRALIALCCEVRGISALDVYRQNPRKRATQDPKWVEAAEIRRMAFGLANSGLGLPPAQLAAAGGVSRAAMHYRLKDHEDQRDNTDFDNLIDRLELALGGAL